VTSFGPVASFYDELMHAVPYRMWVSYYLLLLAQQQLKPKRILDVCCGTGTMCELLDSEGFRMAGFDLSLPMIEQAREKARLGLRNIRYECMDAAEFDMGETYEAAFSFFDSLNYITDPERLRLAFHRVAEHLEPGGSFIFDLNTAYAFEAKMFDQKNLSKKARVRYDWTGDWDPEERIIRVSMKFWTGEEEVEETHVQRAHSDAEIRAWLQQAGFADIHRYHSYTLNPARPKSDRVHYTAIRL
jgi:SAM-dependent methyltransferase